ncbi:MAG: hypothetical protein R2877_02490 [Bdellovibrionota bacterium]
MAKAVVRGQQILSKIHPDSKKELVRKRIDQMYFDTGSAYQSFAAQWFAKK